MTSLRQMRPTDLLHMSLTNLDPLTENYDIGFYFHYMAKWPNLFTVAEDMDGRVVGYIMGKVEEDPPFLKYRENYMPWHGHITALTVAPQHRRLGLATTLSEALERGCEEQNGWFLDLFVRAGNDTAIKMYNKMGYSIFRTVNEYYNDDPTGKKDGEDAYDMRKPLKRDKHKKHIRENGAKFRIEPHDIYHG